MSDEVICTHVYVKHHEGSRSIILQSNTHTHTHTHKGGGIIARRILGINGRGQGQAGPPSL